MILGCVCVCMCSCLPQSTHWASVYEDVILLFFYSKHLHNNIHTPTLWISEEIYAWYRRTPLRLYFYACSCLVGSQLVVSLWNYQQNFSLLQNFKLQTHTHTPFVYTKHSAHVHVKLKENYWFQNLQTEGDTYLFYCHISFRHRFPY